MNISPRIIFERAVLLTLAMGICSCVFFQQEYPYSNYPPSDRINQYSKQRSNSNEEDSQAPELDTLSYISTSTEDREAIMAKIIQLRREIAETEKKMKETFEVIGKQNSSMISLRQEQEFLELEISKLNASINRLRRSYSAESSPLSDTEDDKEGSRGGRRSLGDEGTRTESNKSEGSRGGRTKNKNGKPVLIP